ncbi:hypothetical protein BJX99DRAFT_250458 [Aspergillus californicus]
MNEIFEDPSVFDVFDLTAHQIPAKDVELEILDWHGGSHPVNPPRFSSQIVVPSELHRLPVPRVRIILAPLDLPRTAQSPSLLQLCRHYSVPSAFLEARIRSVTHSFGALDGAEYNCSWFHYLCKNITVQQAKSGRKFISGLRPNDALGLPQTDGTWFRSGFFLRWANPSHTGKEPEVTLICFQAPGPLRQRLIQIPIPVLCASAPLDPHCLLVVVLAELSRQMDHTAWELSDVFGGIETKMLELRHERESFPALHNISKHIIFLLEGSEAIPLTLRAFAARHQALLDRAGTDHEKEAAEATLKALLQVETSFQAVNLRLNSLEKRMQNTISLAYHLVTQEGTRIMQADSSSMATIAFVTLVFLPISAVSTIFGTQFFKLSDADPPEIKVAGDFWIFWAISVPVTMLVMALWYISTRRDIKSLFILWKRRL